MNEQIVTIASLISLLSVWICIFWLYPDYCNDSFRQRMFKIRDEMFDDAALGRLSFEHKTYGILRTTMNGYIRFAHLLDIVQFILLISASKDANAGKFFSSDLADSLKTLSPEEQERYLNYVYRMNRLMLRHIFLSSPVLLISIVAPLMLYVLMRRFISGLLKMFSGPIERLDGLAYAAGSE